MSLPPCHIPASFGGFPRRKFRKKACLPFLQNGHPVYSFFKRKFKKSCLAGKARSAPILMLSL